MQCVLYWLFVGFDVDVGVGDDLVVVVMVCVVYWVGIFMQQYVLVVGEYVVVGCGEVQCVVVFWIGGQ